MSPVIEGDLLLFSADGAREPALTPWTRTRAKSVGRPQRFGRQKKVFLLHAAGHRGGRAQAIISPASDYAFAYDLSGRQLWKFHYPGGYSVVPRPIYAHGLVYICSGYDRPILLPCDPPKGDVTRHTSVGRSTRTPPTTHPSWWWETFLYGGGHGVVSCLNARSGELLWRERVSSSCSASLLHAEGRVYLIDESGETFVFAARDKYELLPGTLERASLASIAATDGFLFIRTASALRRIEE